MHISIAIIAALTAFSFPQAEASPIDIGDSVPLEVPGNVGFTLEQKAYGKRLVSGAIALGNIHKKFGDGMPDDVASAFDLATKSQDPVFLNKEKRATSTTSIASKPKPTTTTSSSSRSSVRTTTTSSSSSSTKAASSTVKTGSAEATPVNEFDTAYMIPITVGGTTVMVDLDTGSSDFWVLSNQQISSQTVNHKVYKPATANLMKGYSWNLTYVDGSSASGTVFNDTVGLGGMNFTGQAIEAAKTASSAFTEAAYDGMLGLAFDKLNNVKPTQQKTLFNSIKALLPSPVFTSLLKHNAPGSFGFGFVDASKYTGAITYAGVDTSNGWWQFTAGGYSFDSGPVTTQSFPAVVDTGTTLMVLPSNIVKAYYAKVANATYLSNYGAWSYPCNADLPNFNLMVGGVAQTVPGSLMTYGPIDYDGNCYGGLQQNEQIGVAILGAIFIKSQFIIYDQSTTPPRLGFAKQKGLSYAT